MTATHVKKGVAATLAHAFAILEEETPAAFHRITRELRGMTVDLAIEHERFSLSVRDERIILDNGNDHAHVKVRTSKRIILNLIDGHQTLLQTVLARDLAVHAALDLLPRLSRATTAFAEGAVRARGMRALLTEFRGGI